MKDGFDFLGFHVQWRRKRGTNKWYVYTYIADRPVRQVKAKIRALTHGNRSEPRDVLVQDQPDLARLGDLFPARRGKHTFDRLHHFMWWRVVQMLRRAASLAVEAVRRRLTSPNGRWRPIHADGIELFNPARCRSFGIATGATRSPTLGLPHEPPNGRRPWRARCVETRTPGSASGLGKRTESNLGTAPQADSPSSSPDLPPHSRLDRGAPERRVCRHGCIALDRDPNRLEHQEIRTHRSALPHRHDPSRQPHPDRRRSSASRPRRSLRQNRRPTCALA